MVGMTSRGAFEIGQQPCTEFSPQESYFGHNEHECFAFGPRQTDPTAECGATVSFCQNCHKDHHAWGYENCGKVASWDEYRALEARSICRDCVHHDVPCAVRSGDAVLACVRYEKEEEATHEAV